MITSNRRATDEGGSERERDKKTEASGDARDICSGRKRGEAAAGAEAPPALAQLHTAVLSSCWNSAAKRIKKMAGNIYGTASYEIVEGDGGGGERGPVRGREGGGERGRVERMSEERKGGANRGSKKCG